MSSIEQIRKWCGGTWLTKADANAESRLLAIDSRNIEDAAATLFIPIKTPLRDGHSYIGDAWQKGVRNFLVSGGADINSFSGGNFIKVNDTLSALQQIAAAHRRQ